MTTEVEKETERELPQGDATGKPLDQRQELGKALAAINRYILAREPMYKNGVYQAEYDEIERIQNECVKVLCGIDDPLVQAIATRLILDQNHHNVRQLIGRLADQAAQ